MTTAISVQDAPGLFSTTGTAVTMTAADVGSGNHFVITGETSIIAQNTSGSTAYTVTITSVADQKTGRTGDVAAVSLAANEIRNFRISAEGWANPSTGYVLISANNAAIKFGLLKR